MKSLIMIALLVSASANAKSVVNCYTFNTGDRSSLNLSIDPEITGTLTLAAALGEIPAGDYPVDLGPNTGKSTILFSVNSNNQPLATLKFEGAQIPTTSATSRTPVHIFPLKQQGSLDLSCMAEEVIYSCKVRDLNDLDIRHVQILEYTSSSESSKTVQVGQYLVNLSGYPRVNFHVNIMNAKRDILVAAISKNDNPVSLFAPSLRIDVNCERP